MDGVPGYVSIVFILTTFLTVGFLFYAIRHAAAEMLPGRVALFLVSFWIIFQAVLGTGGFYRQYDSVPPRILLFGVAPAVLTAVIYLIFFRESFVRLLPLKTLTLLHVVRVPVELVLLWLYQGGQVPREMTFEGVNFDILSGITAPVVYWFAFRKQRERRALLIAWNIFALLLLANIVVTAVMSFPGPLQRIAFEQPNVAVTYFPYVWLPAVIVPIVLFSHLASLWKLAAGKIR